jgi:hypothetical protein
LAEGIAFVGTFAEGMTFAGTFAEGVTFAGFAFGLVCAGMAAVCFFTPGEPCEAEAFFSMAEY